jgi:type IV secretion system protein VirB5
MKRSKVRSGLAAFAAGVMMMCASAPARAGIPVIDVAAIIQAVLDVMNGISQIENQYQQIVGLGQQIESISNARSLGDVLNNPALQNYVPREANTMVRSLESGGYGTLGGASKTLRDAQMTYNCMDVDDAGKRTNCQSTLAKPYQQKAFMEDALSKAKDRVAQINSLMRRAGAENALLQHEVSQIELMRGLAEADQRVADSRAREGQLEQASRNRRLADFIRD